MTVKDILAAVDAIAPFRLTMDFDNTGLLVGDPDAPVQSVLLALDCTDPVIEEAKRQNANLIISHHPVIFKGIKRVTADSVVWKAIRSDISVISAHTNLDIAQGGVNDCLAQKIGLSQLRGLTVTNSEAFDKVIAFVPESHAAAVHQAMTAAGAGTIENYAGCAFFTHGEGSFLPLEGADPYLGTVGEVEKAKEVRIEMICPKAKTKAVVAAMKAAHPYEVPAYDIFEDRGIVSEESLGRVGELCEPLSAKELAQQVKDALGDTAIRYTEGKQPIQTVAVCGGAGDSELESAIRCGAQALVTGEAAHHIFIEAAHRGITLIEAGHFHTEAVVLDSLCQRLMEKFPEIKFTAWHNSPINCL